jgi:glycosyltransferase involved in cell wall biosynthesis
VRILFISRATLYKDKGGDTVQIINTARYLEKLGLQVTIKLCNEKIDYTSYDLLHFFNIIRPADILAHSKRSRKPYVVSTIYVDYSEYERKIRGGITGLVLKVFPVSFIEYLKVVARFLVNGEKIISPSYLLLGQKKAVRKIIRGSTMLLPNSQSEYNRLKADYHIEKDHIVIPNAIDPELFRKPALPELKENNLIICAGRIEGRKNQLALIRALNNTKYQLIIIGLPSANQIKYYECCRQTAASNVSFMNNIPQEELIGYYQKAKVHVLASWFETTGLSSLEAAAMGCNIVITDKGDTREYFENYAYYCDPSSPASIFASVEKAATEDFNEELRTKIFAQYTWLETAKKTLGVYREIIDYSK